MQCSTHRIRAGRKRVRKQQRCAAMWGSRKFQAIGLESTCRIVNDIGVHIFKDVFCLLGSENGNLRFVSHSTEVLSAIEIFSNLKPNFGPNLRTKWTSLRNHHHHPGLLSFECRAVLCNVLRIDVQTAPCSNMLITYLQRLMS